jgi:hypothetical protein
MYSSCNEMKRLLVFCLVIITSLTVIWSEETKEDKKNWKDRSEIFKNDALARDITFGTLAQLKAMAMNIDIEVDNENNATSYRTALLNYYDLKEITVKGSTGEKDKIKLERAGEMRMFRVIEEDEENLHILGKAKLVLESRDENGNPLKKTIEADEIFINLKNSEITGIGNVVYSDTQLEYEGTQFYYNFSSNTGVLFEGRTKILKGGNTGLDNAFFMGERIVQTSNDEAILMNGMITTSEAYNPHYHIRVSRLWIKEGGEWGLLNGLIHIGPVPLFYFPLWYHPKDLIIHPVFGYANRNGWFLNTTYYILGEKEKVEKDSEDLFGIRKRRTPPTNTFNLNKTDVETRLNKFYDKYDFYTKNPSMKVYPKWNNLNMALRIFGDAYTNLGFYTGVYFYMDAQYPNFPMKVHLLSDFGISRLLWKDQNSFVPYDPDHKNDTLSMNNGLTEPYQDVNTFSYPFANPLLGWARNPKYYKTVTETPEHFLILRLPRTSQYLWLDGSLFKDKLNLKYSINLEYATDKSFYEDFYTRQLYFSYMDLLTDSLNANAALASEVFKTTEEKQAADRTQNNLNNEIILNISPISSKIPKPLGLPLLSNISLKTTTSAKLSTKSYSIFSKENPADPLHTRYILDEFKAPHAVLELSGTLLNYKKFQEMPELYREKRQERLTGNRNRNNNNQSLNTYMDDFKSRDTTVDSTKMDYMLIIPLFSSNISSSIKTTIETTYRFEEVIFDETDFAYKSPKDKSDESKETAKKDFSGIYTTLTSVKEESDITNTDIELVDFDSSYSVKYDLTNSFTFADHTDPKYLRYDTLERLVVFNDKQELFDSIIKSFDITNKLLASFNNKLTLFSIGNNPLWTQNPSITIDYKNFWTDPRVTDIYFENLHPINDGDSSSDQQTQIDKRISGKEDRFTDNRKKSIFTIKYDDTITNDLSFGYYRIKGTKLVTKTNFTFFSYNEQQIEDYLQLNELNRGSFPDGLIPSVENFIFYRQFEIVRDLYTTFTLNLQALPKDLDHTLSFSISPKINWVVQGSALQALKDELWDDQSTRPEIFYTTESTEEAKQWVYYRNPDPVFGENLQMRVDRFYNEMFEPGVYNFRKMFSNIDLNANYTWKIGSVTFLNLNNTLGIKLENIGVFATGETIDESSDPYPSQFYLCPDNTLTLTFFNSTIKYTNKLNWSKTPDKNAKSNWFIKLDTENTDETHDNTRQNWDDYKLLTFTWAHTFSFTLKGDLFRFKLPKGNWATFQSTTTFKWNRNKDWSEANISRFYLDSQKFTIGFPMDILKITLNFKSYDFENIGYGVELSDGTINLGYNFTEIPVFWRVFKLTINPSIKYNFSVLHNPYYIDEDFITTNTRESNYYDNNKLIFDFGVTLVIGENTNYRTELSFNMQSENLKMHRYYSAGGLGTMFNDLFDSFRFDDIRKRQDSNFNLRSISFTIDHSLMDWKLNFTYNGAPAKSESNRYYWENTFTFLIEWQIPSNSDNQLLNMLNMTSSNEKYEKGEFQRRDFKLDFD